MPGQKVLVVDDSWTELTMIAAPLRNSGFDVVTAVDGDVRAHGQCDPHDGDPRRAVSRPAVGALLRSAARHRQSDAAGAE